MTGSVLIVSVRTLAALPAVAFKQEHLEDCAQLIRDALDASDRSAATTDGIVALLMKLLR